MCSLSMPIGMENYQGDLTDILRAGAAATGSSETMNSDTWQFSSDDNPSLNFSTSIAMEDEAEDARDNFGDPFSSYIRDPLLHELTSSTSTVGGGFFSSTAPEMSISVDMSSRNDHVLGQHHQHQAGEVSKRPNIFSRMLQISPRGGVARCDPVAVGGGGGGGGGKAGSGGGGVMVGSEMINANSSKGCLLENTGGVGVQISSPRNPGIKRRKSQAKKVVCIPAPAAANSRPTGEVVPSDLWAWRKYGQKPIKGSPYPRGYYRCSSSKGCSARKQVERSRTDPNMLVITYTSEHNHPWPTQRNALAGSTRSQPSKAGTAGSKTSTSPNTSHQQKPNSPAKEEPKAATEGMNEDNNHVLSPVNNATTVGSSSTVKEEFEDIEKLQLEIDQPSNHHQNFSNHDQGFPYRPSMPDQGNNNNQSEDFFADLGEIEADPLNLLFSQCFTADDEQQKGGNKGAIMDPFNLFDWSGDQNTNITTPNNDPSVGHEAKRRL